jgi:hypothetical protein
LWKQKGISPSKCEDKVDQHVNTFEVGSKNIQILIIKMATNKGSMETTKANFVNLCDVGTILSLSCVFVYANVMGIKITNTYVQKIGLNLNSKHETKEPR